jgi:hypothetical protein
MMVRDPIGGEDVRGTFDGRYVYFAPHYNTAQDGVVARLDTTAD